VSTLIARLTALMGEGHVGAPQLVDTWRPGAFTMSDFGSRIADQLRNADRVIEQQSPNRQSPIDPKSEIRDPKSSASASLKSALRRFRFPVPTRVVVVEGRPVRIQIDRQGFSSGAILQSAGPWRTSGNWWDTPGPRIKSDQKSDAWDRDEWDVALSDSVLYRIFQERTSKAWFVDAVVD